MRRSFSLFQSHLDLAHSYWKRLIQAGDTVIDATCGNGHDSLILAKLAVSDGSGALVAIDIQEQAAQATELLLKDNVPEEQHQRIQVIRGSHETFPDSIPDGSVRLIVYNLGYLPGGDKSLTTQTETTIKSLEAACHKVCVGGALSITCYPGHPEGEKEEKAILEWISKLDPRTWSCCHHRWANRRQAPSLLLVQKAQKKKEC